MDLKCYQKCHKREKGEDSHTREGFVKIKAEIGVMWMPAKGWEPPEAGRGKEHILDFGPLKMLNFWPPEM